MASEDFNVGDNIAPVDALSGFVFNLCAAGWDTLDVVVDVALEIAEVDVLVVPRMEESIVGGGVDAVLSLLHGVVEHVKGLNVFAGL